MNALSARALGPKSRPDDSILPTSTMGILWRYLSPQSRPVALLLSCLALCTAFDLWAPLILRRFIDTATAREASDLRTLYAIAAAFIVVNVVSRAGRLAMTWFSEQVGWTATNRLRGDLAAHCLSLDFSFHHARTPGELIERVDGDVTALARFFSRFVVEIIGGVVLLLGILVLLFLQDVRVGFGYCLFAVIAFLLLRASRDFSVPQMMAERAARTNVTSLLEERVAGLEDIRTNAGEDHTVERHDALSGILTRCGISAGLTNRAVWVLTAAIFLAGSLASLGIGIFMYQRGEATIGTVYLFVQYITIMTRAPLNQIGYQLQQAQRAVASFNRIRELLGFTPSIVEGSALLPAGEPDVRFESVSFDYVEGAPILRDISLSLSSGEVLGLLGRTGSGKTTLVRLLCRLYAATAGRILVGDTDIAGLDLPALRRDIGMVTQDVQLFAGSVRDNVRMFDERVQDEASLEVLRAVGLEPWLGHLPEGLDTELAGSTSLSAGEAQLLAFARVFLRDPRIVILDEPSSRVDPTTDRLVDRAIDRLLHPPGAAPRTAIIIAHKLATIARADRIVILERGRIVESGRRAALVADPASRLSALMAQAKDGVLP